MTDRAVQLSRSRSPHVRLILRPLLVAGQLATDENGPVILIDSEASTREQIVTLWHETLHLLGLTDEAQVEQIARKLYSACPEILFLLKDRINVPDSRYTPSEKTPPGHPGGHDGL